MSSCEASPTDAGSVAGPVAGEIRRAATSLFEPGAVVEVRVPNAGQYRTLSGYYDDLDALVQDVAKLETKFFPGVYWTLNPVDPALLARANNNLKKYAKHATTDVDIRRRRWLPIDLDPKRPAGISSSDTEHDAALELARTIRSELAKEGWLAPIFSDSGNGAHLLYPIDLPNDASATELIRNVLAALAARYDDGLIQVDVTTYNAARIFKSYGTTARKGDSTPDRPHRLSRILETPAELVTVPLELLKELAKQAAPAKACRTVVQMPAVHSGKFDVEQFLFRNGVQHRDPVAYNGGRKIVLENCPFDHSHRAPDAAVFERADGQLGFKCLHNSCEGKGWREFRACFETVERNTRAMPEFQAPDIEPWGTTEAWWERENPPLYSRHYLEEAIRRVENEKKWQWVDTYAYSEADGTPVLAKARFLDRANDKTYRSFVFTRKKGWRPRKRGEARALLYRWQNLAGAPQIFIVNNEHAADRAFETLGICTTCHIDGESEWPESLNQTFQDKQVVVVADNNDKGKQQAAATSNQLLKTASEVRIICLPGLSPRGDLSDWIDSGGTLEQLQKLVENAPPFQSPDSTTASVTEIFGPSNSTTVSEISAVQPSAESTSSGNWRSHLLRTDNGEPRALLANVLIALREAAEWAGVFYRDEFASRTVARKPTPWGEVKTWTERDDALVADWLQHHDIRVPKELAGQGVEVVAGDRLFHPVREYLESLTWDGIPRLHKWLNMFLGVEQTPYSAAVGSRWVISAVARIFCPGVKVDTCLILEGDQGIKKSTTLQIMAGEWFTDHLPEIGTKDAMVQLQGLWIIELAELESLSRTDVARVKAFISSGKDQFRPPYGYRRADFPRQCVFAGTVNHNAYLRDETGGRRFWPVNCKAPVIDIDGLASVGDQLWAEAVFLFHEGRTWWMDTPELNAIAKQEQADRYEEDPWDDVIGGWLEQQETTSVADVLGLCLGKKTDQWTQIDKNRVARFLRSRGWERFRSREGRDRQWRYRRPENVQTIHGQNSEEV